MVIYPEGTRNRTGQPLKKFYDGAFRLAVDAKKPVMPVVLLHTREILPADKTFYLRPHSIEMHFLPPVYSEGHSADALKTLVFQQMWDYYALHAPQ
jgi:1-acyl-sn-glycerol-3-phosphate acyltransferase